MVVHKSDDIPFLGNKGWFFLLLIITAFIIVILSFGFICGESDKGEIGSSQEEVEYEMRLVNSYDTAQERNNTVGYKIIYTYSNDSSSEEEVINDTLVKNENFSTEGVDYHIMYGPEGHYSGHGELYDINGKLLYKSDEVSFDISRDTDIPLKILI